MERDTHIKTAYPLSQVLFLQLVFFKSTFRSKKKSSSIQHPIIYGIDVKLFSLATLIYLLASKNWVGGLADGVWGVVVAVENGVFFLRF